MRHLVLESIARFVVVSSLVGSAASCGGGGGDLFPDTIADIDADLDAVETLNLFDTLNDTGPADADTANPACPSGFLCPCSSNGDCLSEICIEGTAGNLCTQTCNANCPSGFDCLFTSLGGSDPLSICVPRHTRLCRPCLAHGECQNPLEKDPTSAFCLPANDSAVGSFCATSCKTTPCPSGYVCSDVNLGAAGRVDVCLPQSGQCTCKPEWSGLGLETTCRVDNAYGSCAGTRGCGPLGLSGCSASIPAAEQCDGLDNDCDGKTDEDFCVIEQRCIAADTVNPENACERCRPGISTDRWTPTVGACDDGDACTKNDACVDGRCRGETYTCPDDGKACTLEACTGTGSCATTLASGQCHLEGSCLADGERKDAKGCLRCDAATNQWVAVQAGTTCDDGNACTTSDVCNGTTCGGTPVTCDDGIACTVDTCANGQCSHQVASGQCHLEGRCLADGERKDATGCLRCDAATNQWVAVPAGASCDDGDSCTTGDVCAGLVCAGQGTCGCDPECGFGQHCDRGTCVDDRNACADGVCYFAFDDPANWERFDLSQKHPTDYKGFGGAIFDGRYVIYAPFAAAANYSGMFYRYDPQAPFGSTTSWAYFDPSDLVVTYRAFMGAAFDGRYAYFAPYNFLNGGLRVLRYDSTSVNFTGAAAAWSTHNLPALGNDSFSGLVYANGQVLLASNASGFVRRYDTTRTFDDAASWSYFDTRAQLNQNAYGYSGIGTDGRYAYLAPGYAAQYHGLAIRYDSNADFNVKSSWELFDMKAGACQGCNAESVMYRDSVFDGRYVYFIPGAATGRTTAWVMCYDTSKSFISASAWSGFEVTSLNARAKAFSGGTFDGRYLYLTPDAQAYNGQMVVAFDTRHSFRRAASWRVFDLASLPGSPSGYQRSAFDGAHYYLAPSDTSVALRLKVRSPAALLPWQPGYRP